MLCFKFDPVLSLLWLNCKPFNVFRFIFLSNPYKMNMENNTAKLSFQQKNILLTTFDKYQK